MNTPEYRDPTEIEKGLAAEVVRLRGRLEQAEALLSDTRAGERAWQERAQRLREERDRLAEELAAVRKWANRNPLA